MTHLQGLVDKKHDLNGQKRHAVLLFVELAPPKLAINSRVSYFFPSIFVPLPYSSLTNTDLMADIKYIIYIYSFTTGFLNAALYLLV